MAEIVSLGLTRPSALSYLIDEAVLPIDADESLYCWHTRQFKAGIGHEELLYTKDCVVWSVDGNVRKVFRFPGQDQKVLQALLATFPTDTIDGQASTSFPSSSSTQRSENHHAHEERQQAARWGTKGYASRWPFPSTPDNARMPVFSPSLAIVLATEVQIHFLSGSSHVVSLPFEVERAYPSLHGIIIRRKQQTTINMLGSPQALPPAPFSSFASQQYLPSQTKSTPTIPFQVESKPGLGLPPQLEALFRSIGQDKASLGNPDIPLFYSLADPLSDFAPILQASLSRISRFAPSDESDAVVDYDFLDRDEEIVYISTQDELEGTAVPGDLPLLIIVTVNTCLQQITVWQSWYLRPQKLSSLLAQSAAHKTAKSQRNGSFANGSRTTGTWTPALRHRDKARESFAASARPLAEFGTSQNSMLSRQVQDDEESMASRMDPDYLPLKQPGKVSKRVSSLLSRADPPNADPTIRQTALGASFGGGGRRGPSVGSFQDRRSFGSHVYRKSRGSTPGSVFSRSIGPGDDMTGPGTRLEDDYLNDEYESIGKMIGATHQSASADAAFGGGMDGSRKEQITRKLDSIPFHSQSRQPVRSIQSGGDGVKAFPIMNDSTSRNGDRHMDIYVLDRSCGNMTVVSYRIRKETMPNLARTNDAESRNMPVPVMDDRRSVPNVHDMERVGDQHSNAVLYSTINGGLKMIPAQGVPCPIYPPCRMRLSDPTDVRNVFELNRREVGRARTIKVETGAISLHNTGRASQITISMAEGQSHRLHIRASPKNAIVRQILQVCQLVLRGKEGRCISTLWCSMYNRFIIDKPRKIGDLDPEWEALIVSLFSFAVGSIGRAIKPKRHGHDPGHPQHDPPSAYDTQATSRCVESESRMFPAKPWGWLHNSKLDKRRPGPVSRAKHKRTTSFSTTNRGKISMAEYEAIARHFLHDAAVDDLEWLISSDGADTRTLSASKIMLALHLFREDNKLDITFEERRGNRVADCLSAIITQFGQWLGFEEWSCKEGTYYHLESASDSWEFSTSTMRTTNSLLLMHYSSPPSVHEWIGQNFLGGSRDQYLTLEQISNMGTTVHTSLSPSKAEQSLLPRLSSLQQLATRFHCLESAPDKAIEIFSSCGLTTTIVETFPEAILAPIKEAITRCQSSPPPAWPADLLRFVGRDDLVSLSQQDGVLSHRTTRGLLNSKGLLPTHDMQSIYASADRVPVLSKTHEAERHAIISLIFSEDRRLVDALRLMNPTSVQVAECPPQPEWSEVEYLDQQKKVMNWVMVRTIALAPGFAMIHFESQRPLLSEQFAIKGFSTSCQMKPMDNTISADRSNFTEEKFGWAFFHSGVSAGLSISQNARGIDTSWIVFNKPTELGNRHAGFLLALGINGHLRSLAKWLAFKYLTPKHNMTSIGLLLGLSASYIGTMDTLITRMLSVHITRMLPQGAAELNVSPSAQTAGLMGIGLLYYNTQHRRMSEVMLSEIEHREIEDPGSTMDVLRDESYRLAAGFALGYINLGQGRHLHGLRSMHLLERLLNVAIGPRPVDLVHVVDKATAGAIIAVALIFMKSGDKSVAQKIMIPDTIAQLEHVRPDLLLLRTMAKHLIMWNEITDDCGWICANLPKEFADHYYGSSRLESPAKMIRSPKLKGDDVPFFNIITGLAWSLGLRFAGSGNYKARDEVLAILRVFTVVSKQETYYYDAKLARNTVRRCVDVLALAAATIMAGTGDLVTFRHLRSLHGRVDPETSYGSHMAAHLAIGALFLGGGTYTFGTSNFAIAALLCAFYPLFPGEVSDNRVHLQALRHLWVFAAEPRCVIVQDIDTGRPINMELKVDLRSGNQKIMMAPCLLPELDTVARITTRNPAYWQVTLDFTANPKHLLNFRRHQTIYVRRSPAYEFSSTAFSSALTALNNVQQGTTATRGIWRWILTLSAFRDFDQAVLDLVLPSDVHSAVHLDEQGTVSDTRLVLGKSVLCLRDRDALWSLKLLFEWAQNTQEHSGRIRWVGREVIDVLRAMISLRIRAAAAV